MGNSSSTTVADIEKQNEAEFKRILSKEAKKMNITEEELKEYLIRSKSIPEKPSVKTAQEVHNQLGGRKKTRSFKKNNKNKTRATKTKKNRTSKRKNRRLKKSNTNTINRYMKQNRVITKLSEVLKYPSDYINKPIVFKLNKNKLDPISNAEITSIGAHIGLDVSEM